MKVVLFFIAALSVGLTACGETEVEQEFKRQDSLDRQQQECLNKGKQYRFNRKTGTCNSSAAPRG